MRTGAAVGNPAVIARRPRIQQVWGHTETVQADLAGTYSFARGKLKPLLGLFYDENWNYNLIRLNTATATSPYYQTWDVNPSSPTYYVTRIPPPSCPASTPA